MNALIISAIMGVLMMFSGILLKQKSTIRGLALAGLLVTIILNVMEINGFHLFRQFTFSIKEECLLYPK